jgi:hypothetical protein
MKELIKTPGKYIIELTGPFLKYRLSILKDGCPNASDYLIFQTDQESYSMYSEYHNLFHFVLMDKYRENYPISLKYEVFPDFKTEKEFLENIGKFYNSTTGNYYPSGSIYRFMFPYLMENDILNFCNICSGTILTNDCDRLKTMFESVPSGCFYAPDMGSDNHGIDTKLKFWREAIQPLFPQIKLESPDLRARDGYVRGYHFKNKEDMKLFYDIWNTATEQLFTIPEYRRQLSGCSGGMILEQEWVTGHLMNFFEHQLNYKFQYPEEITEVKRRKTMHHLGRPEDEIYMEVKQGWRPQFDYSDKSSISAFIKNNKQRLFEYYNSNMINCEVTDEYVYTRLL